MIMGNESLYSAPLMTESLKFFGETARDGTNLKKRENCQIFVICRFSDGFVD